MQIQNKMATDIFDASAAKEKLQFFFAEKPLFKQADIDRVTDLDIAKKYGFAVRPMNAGREGEIMYLVGESKIYCSGKANDFDLLMKDLSIGRTGLRIPAFVNLFLKLKANRRGVILEKLNGHVLLQPDQIPIDQFFPPSRIVDPKGVEYRFWMFDTDLYEPMCWKINIKLDGAITYQTLNKEGKFEKAF